MHKHSNASFVPSAPTEGGQSISWPVFAECTIGTFRVRVIEVDEPQWLQEVDHIVVKEYLRYAPPYSQTEARSMYQLLHQKFCTDHSALLQRSATFVAKAQDEQGREVIAGTIRLVIGYHPSHSQGLPILPSMGLFDVAPEWPHRQKRIPDTQIGELSRLVIVEEYRWASVALGQALLQAAFDKARNCSLRMIYAVMIKGVRRIAQKATFPFEEVAGAYLLQTEQAQSVWATIPGYKKRDPHLYTFAHLLLEQKTPG